MVMVYINYGATWYYTAALDTIDPGDTLPLKLKARYSPSRPALVPFKPHKCFSIERQAIFYGVCFHGNPKLRCDNT